MIDRHSDLIMVVLGGTIWAIASLSRRVERLEKTAGPPVGEGEDKTLALIKGDRF